MSKNRQILVPQLLAIAAIALGPLPALPQDTFWALPDAVPPQTVLPDGSFLARFVEDRDHISIIEVSGDYDRDREDGSLNFEPRLAVAREFYAAHPDHYDFLVVFSTFEFDTGDAHAFHVGVRNAVTGIGLPLVDNSAAFGSAGRLQGYVDMAALTRYETDPLQSGFEQTLAVLAHEVLHQWTAFVDFIDDDGARSGALRGRDGVHWSFLLDSGASVMYGNDWRDNGDGTFTSGIGRRFYSPLDLYLAGFFTAEQVPPMLLVDNPEVDETRLPEANVTISGRPVTVTIDDVLAAEGPRFPAAGEAQKEFRAAFVVLTRPGDGVSDADLVALNDVREAWLTRFTVLTGGRGLMQVFPEGTSDAEPGSPEPVDGGAVRPGEAALADALAWLRGRQEEAGFWQDTPGTRVRDTAVTLETLETLDDDFVGAAAARAWLLAHDGPSTDVLARQAAALGAAGTARRAALAGLRNADGGWGFASGFESDPLDTALAVIALAGEGGLEPAVSYLLAVRDADGGWSNTAGGPSRTGVSAAVVRALLAAGSEVPSSAVAFLAGRQNADGGFGDSPSTAHDTAKVLAALTSLEALGQIDAEGAAGFLLSRQTVAGSWEGSVFTTALVAVALKRFSFPNWTFSAPLDLSPAAPRDGERVTVTARVRNDGNSFAPAGVLRLSDGDPADGGELVAEAEIPALAPLRGATVSLLWDSFDRAGPHTLVAVIDPDGALAELSESDNRSELAVDVAAAPEGADLEVTAAAVAVTPPRPATLPADLAISVTVRNLGRSDVGAARVALRQGVGESAVSIGETTVVVPQRSSTVVHFTFRLTTPGVTRFEVELDPDDAVAEADESNNRATAAVETEASLDLAVADADLELGGAPVLGLDARFRVTLRNRGTLEAPSTTVRYRVSDGVTVRELGSNNVQPGAGETLAQDVVWRVDLLGEVTFSVELDPEGLVPEADETNNAAALAFTTDAVSDPNLVVGHRGLVLAPDPGLEGGALTVSAVVENTGGATATGVEVGFYEGDPAQGGRAFGEIRRIDELAAGAAATVSAVLPRLEGGGDRLIFAVADPGGTLAEVSEDDNAAFTLLEVVSLPDLAISAAALSLDPPFPRPGESVTLTVDVANLGEQEADDVALRAFDGEPEVDGVPVGSDVVLPVLASMSSAQAVFTFTAPEGTRPLVVVVDPDERIAEGAEANNRGQMRLAVQDGDFYVSQRYISPDGDGVRDTTTFFFRFDPAADAVIEVVDGQGEVVRRGPELAGAAGGQFEWDGLDERGRLVRDGDYRLRASGSGGVLLGQATVTVDTNRSSVIAAAGTPFASFTNLTCELPESSNFVPSPQGDAYYTSISSRDDPAFPKGLYRLDPNGVPSRMRVPESYLGDLVVTGIHVAPDGSRIVFHAVGSFHPGDPFEVRLVAVDPDGSNLEELANDGTFAIGFLSPDVLLVKAPENRIAAVSLDGLSPPRELYEYSATARDVSLSPDGSRIAFVYLTGRRSSTLVLLDTETGEHWLIPDDDMRPTFEFSPDGSRLAVVSIDWEARGFELLIYDAEGRLLPSVPLPVEPPPFRFSDPTLGTVELPDPLPLRRVSAPKWSASGTELAIKLEYSGTFVPESGQSQVFGLSRAVIFDTSDSRFKTAGWTDLYTSSTVLTGNESLGLLPLNGELSWVPNERTLYWGGHRSAERAAVFLDEGRLQRGILRRFVDLREERFPASGRELLFRSADARRDLTSSCSEHGFDDVFAFRSLMNLTADLRARRSPTAGGVILDGTAADVHFSSYRLEYAASDAPEDFFPITPPASEPVVDGRFTTWVPPGPGSFFVRLTVEDLAGNRRQALKRVSWADTPAITDLYREPSMISPNGDGIQDAAAIHYRVLEPVHLEFRFFNEAGDRVRTIERDHSLVGEVFELTWDGRGDDGLPLPEGVYRMVVRDFEFFVTLDITAPEVELEVRKPFLDDMFYVDPGLGFMLREEHVSSVELETGRGETPIVWQRMDAPLRTDPDDPSLFFHDTDLQLLEFVDHRFRVRARDQAGNETLVTSSLGDEEVMIYGLPSEFRFRPVRFEGLSTVRRELAQVFVQHRRNETSWSESGTGLSWLPGLRQQIEWDLAGVVPGKRTEIRLRALDVAGAEHFSNSLFFTTNDIIFFGRLEPRDYFGEFRPVLLRLHDELDASGDLQEEEDLLLWGVEAIDRPIAELQLVVRSTTDPRFAVAKPLTPVAYDEPSGVAIFKIEDSKPCDRFSGFLRALFLEEEEEKVLQSGSVSAELPCLDVTARIRVPEIDGCGREPVSSRRVIEIYPKSHLGTPLALFTLSRPAADGSDDVLVSVNQPRSSTETVGIDTLGFEEGVHTLTARLSDAEGQVAKTRIDLVVDRTPPQASIKFPADGTRLCGVPRLTPSGVRNVLPFEGSVVDGGGFAYRVQLRTPRDPSRFVPVEDTRERCYGDAEVLFGSRDEPGRSCPELFGPLATWGDDETELGFSGDATARLEVFDSGGFHVCREVSFYFDGEVEGVLASAPRIFSPNGDGVHDELELSAGAAELSTLEVTAYRAVDTDDGPRISGPVLATVASDLQVLDPKTLTWDGAGDGGQVLADGLYGLVLSFRDLCGNLAERQLFVEIDTTPPGVAVDFPAGADPLPMVVEVLGSVDDPHLEAWQVEFAESPDSSTFVPLARGSRNAAGEVLAAWNTFGLEGDVTLRLVAADLGGNTAEVRVPLVLGSSSRLVTYFEASPRIFSPDDDGRRESASLRFGLAADVEVDLTILAPGGAPVRVLSAASAMPAGAAVREWDGRDDAGDRLADGLYTAVLEARLAADPAVRQQETVTVVLDATPPEVAVLRPAGGFAAPEGAVRGTVRDAHLLEYVVSLAEDPGAPVFEELDRGTLERVEHSFASLAGREEGDYLLRVEARDEAENRVERQVPFAIDATAPEVTLTAPLPGSFLGPEGNPFAVTGMVEEDHLAVRRIEVGAGPDPSDFTTVASSGELPDTETLAHLDVAALAEGLYTLRLVAEDKAGLSAEARTHFTVDKTPPEAALTSPEDGGFVGAPQGVTGTARDADMSRYTVAVAPGPRSTASRFTDLGGGLAARQDATLLDWQALPYDGLHTLRLTVEDAAGNTATAFAEVTVDLTPPAAPQDLAAVSENGDVRLTWTANCEADLAGYRVLRGDAELGSELVAQPGFLDPAVPEGTHVYAVVAVDEAGLESDPSAPVAVDLSPPAVAIGRPADGARVSGIADVVGTASSQDDFREYRLFATRSDGTGTRELLRRSPVPVRGDVLAQWSTVGLAEGAEYVLRLEAEDLAGNVGTAEVTVTVDNEPPAAPTGLVASASGADVTLAWTAASESDLAGYLVFRDGRVANATGTVIGDLAPFVITATELAEPARPDGTSTYEVHALDRAGNLSDASTPAEVTIDTRAPQAVIATPRDGEKLDGQLFVAATAEDTDVGQVRFQFRAAGAVEWTDVGAPDTEPPWDAGLDPAGLAFGDYQLRAVATDLGGRIDPAPAAVTVTFTELTRPAAVATLDARVDGGAVTLEWSAVDETDLAGYHVERAGAEGSAVRITPSPVTGTGFVDAGLADATYTYAVIAVDQAGNEADPSPPAEALVTTPELDQPLTPTPALTFTLTGAGAAGASVAGEVTNAAGTSALPPAVTDAEGRFRYDAVAVARGANAVTVRVTDAGGNVSKQATVEVLSSAPPSAPTGLVATAASDRQADLGWNLNPEPEVIGYRPFRDGAALLDGVALSDLAADASSERAFRGQAANAVDGDELTAWVPLTGSTSPSAGQWLRLTFAPAVLTGAEIVWETSAEGVHLAVDYDIEVWDGSRFVPLARVRDNALASNAIAFARPYRTGQLRILLRRILFDDASFEPLRLAEVRLDGRPLVTATAFSDLVDDGEYTYTVTAVDAFGFESPPSKPANVAVGDVTPPGPVVLTALVGSSDVALSWTASPAADVALYRLSRDGAVFAEHTDLAELSYVDRDRPNGEIRYTVLAADGAGNESAPSNEVRVTVAVEPPPAPVDLTATPAAVGGVIDLAWAPGEGPPAEGFRIFRSTSSGGPYEPVAVVEGPAHHDSELVDGVTYSYVVAALDAAGNQSALSGEASGTPADLVAPLVPVLHAPASPGAPVESEPPITVAGTAEPGAAVTVWHNGSEVGRTTATPVDGSFELPGLDLDDGENVFAAVAVDAAGNRSAESEPIVVVRPVAGRPDLAIHAEDLVLVPPVALAGETVRVSVTVRNEGATTSPTAELGVVAIAPGGASLPLVDGPVLAPIPPGGVRTVSADLVAAAGTYTVAAAADPLDLVLEVSELDNRARRDLPVASDAGPTVAVATDRAVCAGGEDVTVTVEVVNPGLDVTGRLTVAVEDAEGFRVSELPVRSLTVGFGETVSAEAVWNTGSTFAGDYRARAILEDPAGLAVATGEAPFAIAGVSELAAGVASAEEAYPVGAAVILTGSMSYVDGNTPLSGAEAVFRIGDGDGQPLAELRRGLGDLLPGGHADVAVEWPSGSSSIGAHGVSFAVERAGEPLAAAEISFELVAEEAKVRGELVLSERMPPVGEDLQVTFTLANKGYQPLAAVPVEIRLEGTVAPGVLAAEKSMFDLEPGQPVSGQVSFPTAALDLGSYLVVLEARLPGDGGQPVPTTLGVESFTAVDRGAPRLGVVVPEVGGFLGAELETTVRAFDDLSRIAAVTVTVDGGEPVALESADFSAGEYAAVLTGLAEGPHVLVARAEDGAGNRAETAEVAFTVDVTAPKVTITGVADGGELEAPVMPVIEVSDAHPASQSLTLDGKPFVSGTVLAAEGAHLLVATATDQAGNRAERLVSFTISDPNWGFDEQAAAAGLATEGFKEGGLAWCDFNGDGWLDVLVNTGVYGPDTTRAEGPSFLYFNRGPGGTATFDDVTATHAAGLLRQRAGRSAICADLDNDGWIDFARDDEMRIEIYLNRGPEADPPWSFGDAEQGPSQLVDQTIPGGIKAEGMGLLDYDLDGDLDLVFDSHNLGLDLLENDGTGHFTLRTRPGASDDGQGDAEIRDLGLPHTARSGDYLAVGDLDLDGDVDVLARKEEAADLWIHQGVGEDGSVAFAADPALDAQADVDNAGGVALCDLDADGDFDAVWTDGGPSRIWLNDGGVFTATGEPAASAGVDLSAEDLDGVACGDVDNDGDLDLFLAAASGPSFLFLNETAAGGELAFVRDNRGIDLGVDGEGVAFADYDRDGDLDLLVNVADGPNQLWRNRRNDTGQDFYLAVRALRCTETGRRDDVGAVVRLFEADAVTPLSPVEEVNGGRGHGSQSPAVVHFGLPLGRHTEIVVAVTFLGSAGEPGPVVTRRVVPSAIGGYALVEIASCEEDQP